MPIKLFLYIGSSTLCPKILICFLYLLNSKLFATVKLTDEALFIENFSDPTEDYLFKNPAGFFPVLNTSFNENIVGSIVIVEYLQNLMIPPTLMIRKMKMKLEDYSFGLK